MGLEVPGENLNETAPLPELSFDDLLDDELQPVKTKDNSAHSDDHIIYEPNDYDETDNVLNTPVAKKNTSNSERASVISCIKAINNEDLSKTIISPSSSLSSIGLATTPNKSKGNTSLNTSSSNEVITTPNKNKIITTTVLINNKTMMTKTGSPITNQIVKLANKPSTTAAAAAGSTISTSSAITPVTIAGKTAIKTPSGKIIYLQKTGSMSAVRLQSGSTVKTGTVVSSIASKTNNPKPVAIQVMKTADGSFVPVKTVPSMTSGGNTSKMNTFKISSSPISAAAATANNIGGKKVITTSSGQVVIKAPLTPISGAAVAAIQKASLTNSAQTLTSLQSKAKQLDLSNVGIESNTSHSGIPNQSKSENRNSSIITMSPGSLSTSTVNATDTTVVGNTTITKTNYCPDGKTGNSSVIPSSSFPNRLSTNTTTFVSSGSVKQNIVVKGANGKPIVVPNQNIIKLSPKVVQNSGTLSIKGAIQSANGGQLRAIQIPGKPGKQWVRVLPQKQITSTTTTSSSGTITSSLVTKLPSLTTTTASLNANQGQVGSSIKNLGSVPPKFTIVRPVNNSSIVLTHSPKVDNLAKTTVVSKMLPVTSSASSTVANITATSVKTLATETKSTISEPKTDMKRLIGALGGFREVNAIELKNSDKQGKKIVLMPLTKTGQIQRITAAQSAAKTDDNDTTNAMPKLVLKNDPSDEVRAKIKSFFICSKARALMIQKQNQQQNPQNKNGSITKEIADEIQYEDNLSTAQLNINSTDILLDNMNSECSENEKKLEQFEEPTGAVRRKHCNCSKSQCLKLYCDCFANGEFCKDCTCKDCFNNLQYEDERQRAIRTCLERNPSAFKPKITTASDYGDTRLHNKGCNCKRSGCLKNYCECYEAKIPCSSNCKCVGCRNVEDRPDLDMDPQPNSENSTQTVKAASGYRKRDFDSANQQKDKIKLENDNNSGLVEGQPLEKRPCNIITQEVFEATIQCMISQADECEKNDPPYDYITTEHMVIKEVGRCLEEILNFSINNSDMSFSQE